MFDGTGFPVHEVGRADNVSAKGCTDGLMSKADPEQRYLSGKVTDDIDADARFLWRARAGRDQDVCGIQRFDFVDGCLIVAANDNFSS